MPNGTDNTQFTAYRAAGGTLSQQQWIAAGKPSTPTGDIRSDDDVSSITQVLASQRGRPRSRQGGQAETPVVAGPTTPDTITPVTIVEPGGIGVTPPENIITNADGSFSHRLGDKIFATREDAMADFNSTLESQANQAAFQTDLGAFQQNIQDIGATEAARAQRLSARNLGTQTRGISNALLATGRTPGEIAQLTSGGIEASQRGLSDLLVDLNLQTQRAEAGAQQFGLTGSLTQEGLAQRRSALASQQGQFQQNI